MVDHTPTPWRVEQGTGLVWGNCTVFDDGTPDRLGVPVTDGQLERPWSKGNGPTYEEMEANAAFIVKAVNNHDSLVKALARLEDANDKLAALRTQEMYLTMLDAGQEFVLADLQDARTEATRILSLVGPTGKP